MTLSRIVVLMIVALEGAAFAEPSAEDLFDQGQTSFVQGDYATAVAKWNESYRLSKAPELLFNIAQALENEGRCAEALAAYRRFIAIAPGSAQRHLADKFVLELQPKCDVAKAASRENQSSIKNLVEHTRSDHDLIEHHNQRHPAGLKIAGLAVIGAGAVSVATGLYFGHHASTLGEEVSSACRSGCDWAVYGSKDAEGRRAETKQYVFAGMGLAAIVGGGVTFWLASRQQRPMSIAIAPGRDGAAVIWGGAW